MLMDQELELQELMEQFLSFFKQKLENKPFTVVGNGNQKRDFVFVTDVVNAFYKAATNKVSGQIFNLGSSKPKSVNELVKILGGKNIYTKKTRRAKYYSCRY